MLPKEGLYLGYNECRRIHCGLRWDPVAEEFEDKTDLDLVYVTYNEYGQHIATVSGKDGIRSDDSGSLYHTGDDMDGSDDVDDERITLDLLAIPQNIHHIFMVVEVCGKHTFGNIHAPQIRILKGIENEQVLNIDLTNKLGTNAKSYIFTRLERQAGGWHLSVIDQYLLDMNLPDWGDLLLDYLPAIANEKKSKANLPPRPGKGQIVPLSYTKQAQHRILCGLSWDQSGEGKKAGSIADLDLTCILYDANGHCLGDVSSEAARSIDRSGAVYHSGDDVTGLGKGDDETISVELIKLPGNIHHAVFVVDMKTNHTFGQIRNPEIRIADGMTNQNQLDVKFNNGGNNNAYIFAHLARNESAWMLHYIGQFIDTASVSDWSEVIKPHLERR